MKKVSFLKVHSDKIESRPVQIKVMINEQENILQYIFHVFHYNPYLYVNIIIYIISSLFLFYLSVKQEVYGTVVS